MTQRFSVLPAISLRDGIIHCKIIEGSFCAETFAQFIESLLDDMQPYPAPNSVIVMDNCRIHKHPQIQALIRERSAAFHLSEILTHGSRGMRCEFLPPYSPDYNPIELAFSYMKYNLRRNGNYVRLAMTEMSDENILICLFQALYSITPDHSRSWYHYCGYI
jgi:transposase